MPEITTDGVGLEGAGKKDIQREIEQYLPDGFPEFLFQGTSLENAEMVKNEGLGGGTLSTYIFDCLSSRFYREGDGRLIVTGFDAEMFKTDDIGSKQPPHQYYEIQENTGQRRKMRFSRVDTDGVKDYMETETDCYVDAQKLGCLQFSPEQLDYLMLVSELIGKSLVGKFDENEMKRVAVMLRKYNLPDSAAGMAGAGVTVDMIMGSRLDDGADLRYRYARQQRRLAEILELQIADFADDDSLQKATDKTFSDEEVFFDKLAGHFPGELNWNWKNIKENDRVVVKALLRQIYQKGIISKIKTLLLNMTPVSKQLMLKGKSVEGLNKIKEERNIN